MIKTMLLLLISLIVTYSSIANGDELTSKDEIYNQLLEAHQKQGYLNKKELNDQKFQLSNNKSWQKQFKKQVRGVASSLNTPREKIELSNPAIEISVK